MAQCSSLAYADMLAPRDVDELGGGLGVPERFDNEVVLREKCKRLAEMIREAAGVVGGAASTGADVKQENVEGRRGVVVFTGAGISTACGIPDFRGPNGVWTNKAEGRPPPTSKTPFGAARPSYTHMALRALMEERYVKYIVSQNVDGLHVRSGLTRKLDVAEIHGNALMEKCEVCGAEYVRDFAVETLGFRRTKRKCTAKVDGAGVCGGRLRDMNLDWESPLPDDEYEKSIEETESARLVVCIGTSLRIKPICNVPQKAEKMAIVNLQPIPKEKKAALVVRGKSDDVMRRVVAALGIRLPVWRRWDGIRYGYKLTPKTKSGKVSSTTCVRTGGFTLEVRVGGTGGDGCPVPWLESATALLSSRCTCKNTELRWLKSKSIFVVRREHFTMGEKMDVGLDLRVHDKYFSEPIREIMKSAPTNATLREMGLEGTRVTENGHLIRHVHFTVEASPNLLEQSFVAQFLGDEYRAS